VGLADSESGIKARLKEAKYEVSDIGKLPKITLRSLQSDWGGLRVPSKLHNNTSRREAT
jgi:hypothetical protein